MSLYIHPLSEVYDKKDIHWRKFKLWYESEKLGVNIPKAFLVKDGFVHDFFAKIRLAEVWAEELSRLDITKISEKSLEKLSIAIQKKILKGKFDDDFLEEFRKQYSAISEFKDTNVEIRFLDSNILSDILAHRNPEVIKGEEKICDEIKRNLATIFEAKNLYKYYLAKNTPFNFDFTFLIQKFTHFDAHGAVMNLTNSNNLETLILARFGDPENLDLRNIGSLVTDEYIVKNFNLDEITTTLAEQEKMIVRSAGKIDSVKISKSWMDKPKISDEKVTSIATFFIDLSKEFKTADLKVYWGLESGKFWLIDVDDSGTLDLSQIDDRSHSSSQNFFDPISQNQDNDSGEISSDITISEETLIHEDESFSNIQDLIDTNDYSILGNTQDIGAKEERNKGIVIINTPEKDSQEDLLQKEAIPTDPKERAKYILFKSPKKSNIDIYAKNRDIINSSNSVKDNQIKAERSISEKQNFETMLDIPNILDTLEGFKLPDIGQIVNDNEVQAIPYAANINKFFSLAYDHSFTVFLQAYIFTKFVKNLSREFSITDGNEDIFKQDEKDFSSITSDEDAELDRIPVADEKTEFHEKEEIAKDSDIPEIQDAKESRDEMQQKDIMYPTISMKIISGQDNDMVLEGIISEDTHNLSKNAEYMGAKCIEVKWNQDAEKVLKDIKLVKVRDNIKNLILIIKGVKNIKDMKDLKLILNSLNLKNTASTKICYSVDNIALLNNLTDIKDENIHQLLFDMKSIAKLSGIEDLRVSTYQHLVDLGVIKLLNQVITYKNSLGIELFLDLRDIKFDIIDEILQGNGHEVSTVLIDQNIDILRLKNKIADIENSQILKSIK